MSDELAEAEEMARYAADRRYPLNHEYLVPVMAEYDAMQPIVEAAVRYVAAHTGPVSLSKDAEKAQAMVELIWVVKGRGRGE